MSKLPSSSSSGHSPVICGDRPSAHHGCRFGGGSFGPRYGRRRPRPGAGAAFAGDGRWSGWGIMSSGEAPLMAAAVTIEGSAARERTEGGDRWMQHAPAESRPCFYRRRWGGGLGRGARFHAGYGGWDAHAHDGEGGGWVLAVARGEGLVRTGRRRQGVRNLAVTCNHDLWQVRPRRGLATSPGAVRPCRGRSHGMGRALSCCRLEPPQTPLASSHTHTHSSQPWIEGTALSHGQRWKMTPRGNLVYSPSILFPEPRK